MYFGAQSFNAWMYSILVYFKSEGERDVIALVNNMIARGIRVTVITQNISGCLVLPSAAKLIELHGNVSQLVCEEGHCKNVPVDVQCQGDQLCDECNKVLKPSVSRIDLMENRYLPDVSEAMDNLHAPGGAILCIGTCDHSWVRKVLTTKNSQEEIPLMQISKSYNLKNAIVVPANPRDVLFEIIDDMFG